MPTWPSGWDGLRIGHFSDLHYGDLMPVDRGLSVVELLGAERPDLVAFTGDMVDLSCDGAEPLFEAMVGLDAPLGAFMVIGNHDLLDDVTEDGVSVAAARQEMKRSSAAARASCACPKPLPLPTLSLIRSMSAGISQIEGGGQPSGRLSRD